MSNTAAPQSIDIHAVERDAVAVNLMRFFRLDKHRAREVADFMRGTAASPEPEPCPLCKRPATDFYVHTEPGEELGTRHCGCYHDAPVSGGIAGAAPAPEAAPTVAADSQDAALEAIGDFAHDRSTGPAVPDALWEVRSMAYEGMQDEPAHGIGALPAQGGDEP